MSDYDQYQQPIPPMPPNTQPPGQGMAVASLVLGIVSIIFCWTSLFAVIFMVTAIVGVVLAISAKKKNAEMGMPPGLATGGLVLNIIALVFSAIGFLTCGVCTVCLGMASMLG